eukprot:1188909-Prorocentrum_minimum.AAC.1
MTHIRRKYGKSAFYGSSCANNGKDALNTPETLTVFVSHIGQPCSFGLFTRAARGGAGDGTGVGKGRQIAGVLVEHWRSGGRRALWLSVSTDLKWDAERDLRDLRAPDHIPILPKGNATIPSGPLTPAGGFSHGLLVRATTNVTDNKRDR